MNSMTESYVLDPETVDTVSGFIMEFCEEVGTSRRDALRHRISTEECMLNWIKDGLDGEKITIESGRFLGTSYIRIRVTGKNQTLISKKRTQMSCF